MIYFSVIHLLLVEQWYAFSLPHPFPCSLWIRTCLSLDWICKVNSCLCAFVCSIEFLCHYFFFLPPDYFLLSLLTIIQNVRMQPHTHVPTYTHTHNIMNLFALNIVSWIHLKVPRWGLSFQICKERAWINRDRKYGLKKKKSQLSAANPRAVHNLSYLTNPI